MFELVSLNSYETEAASRVGLQRYEESRRKGIYDKSSTSDANQRLKDDMLGACAELAFCKWRGCVWEAHVNTFHEVPDVAPYFEVRQTPLDSGRLIVRPNDTPERLYVLLTGTPERFIVRGWIGGGGARRDEWWRDPRNLGKPAWWVPQSHLFDPGCLKL